MSKFNQGYYKPIHPEKYVGDITKIRFMSSWELSFDKFLDHNPNVLRWSAEPFSIPYLKPTTGRIHKYFPDYFVEYKNKSGELIKEILEIKPQKQTTRSKTRNPKSKLYEDLTFAVNTAKWQAAQKWCDERGLKFKILTELSIFKAGK